MINKNEVVAHVIMEQTAPPCATNVRDYSHNGLVYVIFETVFQSFGVKNRNKRMMVNTIFYIYFNNNL